MSALRIGKNAFKGLPQPPQVAAPSDPNSRTPELRRRTSGGPSVLLRTTRQAGGG